MARPDLGHERSDVDVAAILRLGAVALLLTLFTVGLLFFVQRTLMTRERTVDGPRPPLAGVRAPYAGPRLQIAPADDLAVMRAREDAQLSSYGWVNREMAIARIPITRAMDLIADGVWPFGAGPHDSGTGATARPSQP